MIKIIIIVIIIIIITSIILFWSKVMNEGFSYFHFLKIWLHVFPLPFLSSDPSHTLPFYRNRFQTFRPNALFIACDSMEIISSTLPKRNLPSFSKTSHKPHLNSCNCSSSICPVRKQVSFDSPFFPSPYSIYSHVVLIFPCFKSWMPPLA